MVEANPKISILYTWIGWHFKEALAFLFRAWWNYLKSNMEFFSIPLLLRTLFSHWHRYKDSYGRGFDPKVWINAFVGNVFSRIIGFIARIVIISVGLVFELITFAIGLGVIIFWILLPFLIIFLFWSGLYLVIG